MAQEVTDDCKQDVYQWPGDPTGMFEVTGPAVCKDTVHGIVWVKDTDRTSSTDWH